MKIAANVERAVDLDKRRADRSIAYVMKSRRDLALPDQRFVSRSIFSLFRWRGWIDGLDLPTIEDRLLVSWLLDCGTIHPACRIWAEETGRDVASLIPLGDAPNWTARAEGLKRLLNIRAINADPWRLFPNWFREELPIPPGTASIKLKYLELLDVLQRPAPLWIRAQGDDEKKTWNELNATGVKPWVHRTLTRSAKLAADVDIYHLPAFIRGDLEIQDLASQAVGLACDPDPGERWWDVCAGAGGKALHLTALLRGKGTVLATDVNEKALKEAARRARRTSFRNLSTKLWDGKRMPAKSGTFDGVLVDAPCSGIGTWRRNPDARWTLDHESIGRLAETQFKLLEIASKGVKPGGVLMYSVCTLTPRETTGVVGRFLEASPGFRLDPFPHPLLGSPCDGKLQIWPQEADTDAMFIARMIRVGE